MQKKNLPPNYLVDVLALTLLLLSLFLYYVFYPIPLIVAPYNYIGILFVVFGFLMVTYTNALLKTNKTTIQTYDTPNKFVTTGFFEMSRNPIYLGITFILLGTAIFFGSIFTFLSVMIFVILLDWFVIPFEEKTLQKVFGKQYLQYKIHVRRWI